MASTTRRNEAPEVDVMRLATLSVLLVGCSDYRSINPKLRIAGWQQTEVSCDEPPTCEGEAASHCVCAERPAWQLQDVNQNSARFTETFGLDAFEGKVVVLSLYKVNCAFCAQQMGYLQVLKDHLAGEGFDVAFASLLKNSGEVGTTCGDVSDCTDGQTCEQGFCHSSAQKVMSAQRDSYGACALFNSPNCDGNERGSQVTVTYPVFQDTAADHVWATAHDGAVKDEFYVYRPDGRLALHVAASERIVLSDLAQYRAFKAKLKAMALGKVACDAQTPCAEGQWCRQPETAVCGMSGYCAPNVEVNDSGQPVCPVELYPQPVCGCDGETYANVCIAASQGVSVFDNGHCLE